MSTSAPRVRYAPSPTGYLHVGGLRTALYNFLLARKHGGTYILRLEDTDRERFVPGSVEKLAESLVACGVVPDEGVIVRDGQVTQIGEFGPYIQSERREQHLAYAQELIQRDKAYYCFCSKERLAQVAETQKLAKLPAMYDRLCRTLPPAEAAARAAAGEAHVIRLKVPTTGGTTMRDLVHGQVTIPWAQIDDQVLIKSDGFPTYHLAATADDHDMEITHVLRGEEWLPSLPKHLFIFEAMGWTAPQYAHLPLLLNSDRSKLSKRQGDVAVEDYIAKGYLPEALVNFVALLGWNPGTDQEIFSIDALIKSFDLEKINKSGAVFNPDKLDWLNSQYIHKLSDQDFWQRLVAGGFTKETQMEQRAAKVVKERLAKLGDFSSVLEDVTSCADYDASLLVWKKSTPEQTKVALTAAHAFVSAKPDAWFLDLNAMEQDTFAWIEEQGWKKGDVLWPVRVALSGRKTSPGPFEMMHVIQKSDSVARLASAVQKIEQTLTT